MILSITSSSFQRDHHRRIEGNTIRPPPDPAPSEYHTGASISLRIKLLGPGQTISGDAHQADLLTFIRVGEVRSHSPAQVTTKQGENDMGDKGSKDKGKKETQKKAQHTLKEKRKLKKEKKDNK